MEDILVLFDFTRDFKLRILGLKAALWELDVSTEEVSAFNKIIVVFVD